MSFPLPKRAIFFSAHPDDELGGAGGLLLKIMANGGAVHLVLCIDPAEPRMDGTMAQEECAMRVNEFQVVAKAIGASSTLLKFSRYPGLSYTTILPCVRAIRTFRPDAVIILQEDEYHTEHALVARIVKRAVWHAGRAAFPECGASHKTESVWEAEGDRPMHDPNHLEDISEVVLRKTDLFELYGSQQKRKDLVAASLGLNKFRGVMYKRGTYAEAFKITDFFYG